ncbi:MAG: acetoacetate--CoA ligase [Burkholderiaceae bacterium]
MRQTASGSAPLAGEGERLWAPSRARIDASGLAAYERWLAGRRGLQFDDYAALWQWSVDSPDAFWDSIREHFDMLTDGDPVPVLASREMPGARWYPGLRLNYAEHVFRHATEDRPALIERREDAPARAIGWNQLAAMSGAFAQTLRELGIAPGDRVASYLPNRAETVAAFLACASIGAIWTSCAPDMGPGVVIDRLRQVAPRVLLATESYSYNGKLHDRSESVSRLLEALPSVETVIHVQGPREGRGAEGWRGLIPWEVATASASPLNFERLPFDHPLWIVYSSGTTGLPKAMVHGHGGIVLTHLKTMALQHDVRRGDRLLFLGGTGWIVWNLALGALLTGATTVLYDGNPAWPTPDALWRFIDEQDVTLFGCGAAYLINCAKQGLSPGSFADLRSLRAINATGSPLPVETYRWVYREVKADLWLASISGGTDIASGFVACAPNLPVHAGEIQCRELGVAAYAFDEQGKAVVDQVGELVITQPMPSMPLHFWNDPGGSRYRESYFETYPGLWRHGDWIKFTPRGTAVIYGRSDSTINRFGIRMGTAEIYRVVEAIDEIADSLVVDLEYLGRPSFLALFVVLRQGVELDDALRARIADAIRRTASPRHVPDDIFVIDDVPRTLTGKKMEVPVRKMLLGMARDKVASPEAMANPASLDTIERLAALLAARLGR